jgi:hypothetical protein
MQPLELAGERHIAIKDRGHLYSFTLAPIAPQMWMKYFDSIVSTSENRNREQLNTFDTSTPLLALVSEALLSAEGYKIPDTPLVGGGSGPISEIPNWKSQLPIGHRLAIGQMLTRVSPVDAGSDDEAVALGSESVVLESLWNSDANGAMMLHRPLVHHFATPSFEDERRYLRDQSRSKVIGGSRTGKTVWTGVQRALVEIYDELIQSVEGYTVNGSTLVQVNGKIAGATKEIPVYMDTYHKVVAAQQLFKAPPADPTEEAEAA